MEQEIDFEHLEAEILEIEKNVVTNRELNFVFAQPTNWYKFSDEDDSESQEDENDSTSQVSQRELLINKKQEVWVNEEFEDDSENGKSIKEKKTKGVIKLLKKQLNINNQSLVRVKWKNLKRYSYLKKFKRKLKYHQKLQINKKWKQ